MPIDISKIPISTGLHQRLSEMIAWDAPGPPRRVKRFATLENHDTPCWRDENVATVGIDWLRSKRDLWELWGNEIADHLSWKADLTTKETIEHLRWDVQEYMILFPDSERLAALYDKLTFDSAIRVLKGNDGETSSAVS